MVFNSLSPFTKRHSEIHAGVLVSTISALADYDNSLEGECSAEQFLYKLNSERLTNSRQRNSLDRLELLRQVCEYTSKVMPSLETEFLSMTRDCSDLLLRIRKAMKLKLDIEHCIEGSEYCDLFPF